MRFSKHTFLSILFLIGSLAILAQTSTIKGQLTGVDGEAIAFADIGIPGTKFITTSTEKGNYQLEVPADRDVTIIFSHVSYEPLKQL